MAVLIIAASCVVKSSIDESAEPAIEGVWEGTFQANSASDQLDMCIHFTRAEAGPGQFSQGMVVTGTLYVGGGYAGLVVGTLDPEGAISFGGGSEIGTFTGTLGEDTAFGAWDKKSPDAIGVTGGWTLEESDLDSCA